METKKQTIYKGAYLGGIMLCAISLCIYLLGSRQADDLDLFSHTFFLNYGLAIVYLVILLVSKRRHDRPRPDLPYACWINVVILFTISAFSLNREMNVFARFPLWLNIYTVLSVPLFLLYPYYHNMPKLPRHLLLLLTGSSLTLSVYMFLYLLPLVPFSAIALIAMGISVHTFVPALWLWVLLDFMLERIEKDRARYLIIAGALLPLIFLGLYLNKWYQLKVKVRDIIVEQNLRTDRQLPDAVSLAQKLPEDPLTDEILVSAFKAQRFWGSGWSIDREGGQMYHNPLATLALGMFGETGLDQGKVLDILNIRKNYRHQTSEKLWTGISLSTSAVSSNILVYPQYRQAYHEKTFMIHNDPGKNNRDAWFTTPTQEALYTFHVPEGSIVTSLSLWIDGKEHRSRLSTRQKADSAYKTIVGTERRDPAIVHWKEGNTISVNIFPCTPKEDRKFKIGFTTPLKLEDSVLHLENIWFEGPDFSQAQEITKVITNVQEKRPLQIPVDFELQANGEYIYKGDYRQHWEIKFEKETLSDKPFFFGGFIYSLTEAAQTPVSAKVQKVFLDITSEWTKEEFDDVTAKLAGKDVYAWLPEKTKITAANRDLIWQNNSRNRFSVPFIYDIKNPANAVVITKTPAQSPLLGDLGNSEAAARFSEYFAKDQDRVNVINIGDKLSPFWRTLRELRLVNYMACDRSEATDRILKGNFGIFKEDSALTVIQDSRLAIHKTKTSDSLQTGTAPDHLLRLFAYNDLLRRVGRSYFEKEKYEDGLFREAEEAHVVSPVTSMIVLETEHDYERMGIHENNNSVGNASVLSGGAVPEPHEWALIILALLLIVQHLFKQKRLSLRS